MSVCMCVQGPKYLEIPKIHIANCYTIEGFCYSNGKMIHNMCHRLLSQYVYIMFIVVANHFLTRLANSINDIFRFILNLGVYVCICVCMYM